MTHLPRRQFLKNTLATAVLIGAGSTGLFRPGWALAAEWPKDAFAAKQLDEAIRAVFGPGALSPSPAVK
ncbi:MAG: twin-arginine translocation signal domain-containing protein, partial [Pseudomonadota bacterium]